MAEFDLFYSSWKRRLQESSDFHAHQYAFKNSVRAFHELLPDLHFLLREELRHLEAASGLMQENLRGFTIDMHQFSFDRRFQIPMIEQELLIDLEGPARQESVSFVSYCFFSLEQLVPVCYFGPYFHFRSFLYSLMDSETSVKPRFLDEISADKAAWMGMMRETWLELKKAELSLVEESLQTSMLLFEHLLRSIPQLNPSVSGADAKFGGYPLEKDSQFNFFHERRAALF